ncbi:hypothetical protein GCM10009745_59530 [Kribbella yunnanensis]|uniref:SH3 domain-containing protein n=1 Tax=Kribbella yunnanensis TaxID=190194 RepID=A0ABN2IFL3_9ACTN
MTTSTPSSGNTTPPAPRSHLLRNLTVGAGVLAAVGGLLVGIGAVTQADESKTDRTATNSGGSNNTSNNGDHNTSGSNNTGSNNSGGNTVVCPATDSGAVTNCPLQQIMGDETLTDPEFRKQIAAVSTDAPAAPAPYQFVVVDTGKLGVKVRTGPETSDMQFGSAGNRSILWVDCQVRSSFDADPTTGAGPVWLKVRWPNTTGTEWANSQPRDPARGWVYRGYAIPAGHNGDIPACS